MKICTSGGIARIWNIGLGVRQTSSFGVFSFMVKRESS